jgi:O-antigen ligase
MDIVMNRLGYMTINLLIYIAIYNFILETKNKETLLKFVVWAAVISLAFIMVSVEDIWTGRLGHTMSADKPSFYVYGIPLYLSGNSISTFTDIGALFSLYFAGVKKKKLYFFTYVFLAFGTLLSGSRKGLLLLGLFTVYSMYSYFKGANLSKFFKIAIAVIVLYYIVMKVPVFYKLIGRRTTLMISSLFGQDVQEGSFDNRMRLAGLARQYIAEKPIFGWGLGNFAYLANSKFSVDNNYLDILVSCGVFAIVIYYYYVVLAIQNYMSLRRRKTITVLTETMFFVVLCFLILDFGSVTYIIRNQLMWVVVFFAFAALDKKNVLSSMRR